MSNDRVTAKIWRKVCRLHDVEVELGELDLRKSDRAKLLREQRSIETFLTPPRVSQANRWRRRVINIAMQHFSSGQLPPIKKFVALPAIQDVLQSDDVPRHWVTFPNRTIVSIRDTLLDFGFVTAPSGRPVLKTPQYRRNPRP